MSQPIDFTAKTKVQRLLEQYSISNRRIAISLGINPKTVASAMTVERHGSVQYETVKRIRRRAEALLCAMGWKGDPADLWKEYEQHIEQHAA
jgi:hypothetical protein